MFERLISIDWSGAGAEPARVALRVAEWSSGGAKLVAPPSARGARNWSREEALEFLTRELHPRKPRTAVAIDFAFGLPWGADAALFSVTGWHAMLRSVRDVYAVCGRAEATAQAINRCEQFEGHGPYRFDDSRADFRFYLDRSVAYYRAIELVVPQAISVWYVGSGSKVGFQTITGMACLAELLDRRDEGLVDFTVWPQERHKGPFPGHVLLEGYPAVLPAPESFGPCHDAHDRDAWRILQWMRAENVAGRLESHLEIPSERVAGLVPNTLERVRFEGWILGVV